MSVLKIHKNIKIILSKIQIFVNKIISTEVLLLFKISKTIVNNNLNFKMIKYNFNIYNKYLLNHLNRVKDRFKIRDKFLILEI